MATKRPDPGNRVRGTCRGCGGPLAKGRCLGLCLSMHEKRRRIIVSEIPDVGRSLKRAA